MSADDEIRNRFRVLVEAGPREAGLLVQQRLLIRFRERRRSRKRRAYFAGITASVALAAGLWLALWQHHDFRQRPGSSELSTASGFIPLPYAESGVPMEQPVIVRVNLLPSPGTGERVKADLLVGQDGVARAVRFVP